MRPPGTTIPALALLLAACGSHGGARDSTTPTEGGKANAYAGIGAAETLRFTGTEPFWGGSATGATLTYTTPDKPEGTTIPVRRFAGNNGLGFSGMLGDSSFDLAVSEVPCSDGMSDRTYPFTVTLRIAEEVRGGCGWTDRRKSKGPEHP